MNNSGQPLKYYPKWLRDIIALLPIKSQFVLTGNIRDTVLIDNVEIPCIKAIGSALATLGYRGLIVWDIIGGLRAQRSNSPEAIDELSHLIGSDLHHPVPMHTNALPELIEKIVIPTPDTPKTALIIDYASRLYDPNLQSDNIQKLFISAEKLSREATPFPAKTATEGSNQPTFNPVFWLANRPGDIPYWLTADSERIRTISIPLPDAETRYKFSQRRYHELPTQTQDISEQEFSHTLANLTHNMTLNALWDICDLARASGKPASNIDEAVQSYRVGDLSLESPWRSNHLRQRILEAEDPANPGYIGNRVKGQKKAIQKVLDILKRTSVGLTGAQTSNIGTRPRGVLFFAGPTGVGKTELAKAIAQMVFGDENAYKRFDMSEFSAEHSGDRLIGAPPGYVGFDQGGELTNAVREQPFRVLLFDEVEKAHHRILDKFLQILEDGRLTDGRGDTVYFSDSLIIFTSNAGISKELPNGEIDYIIKPEEMERLTPDQYESRVLDGVKSYFRNHLGRPELLNRLGENIIVFSYITQAEAIDILNMMINNVIKRVKEEHDIHLHLEDPVQERLKHLCLENLINGGRGIGSKLEEVFINPLARLIFDNEPTKGQSLTLTELTTKDATHVLKFR